MEFAKRSGIFRGMLTGISGGLTWFLIFASYALAFWYGVKLVMDDSEACIQAFDLLRNATTNATMASPECNIRYEPKTMLVVRILTKVQYVMESGHKLA